MSGPASTTDSASIPEAGRDLSKRATLRLAASTAFVTGALLLWAASYVNTITPQGIVIHHTSVMPAPIQSGSRTTGRTASTLAAWDEFHRLRGFGAFYWGRVYHLGYHYMIFPDGTVKQGRPEHCLGAHAKGFNNYLGIVLVGDFSSKSNPKGEMAMPTREQMQALVLLCHQLRERYGIPLSRIVRHCDVGRTMCPGDRFPYREFLRRIQ
jgi:hypothetical protein